MDTSSNKLYYASTASPALPKVADSSPPSVLTSHWDHQDVLQMLSYTF